jgi:DNA repair photolyase
MHKEGMTQAVQSKKVISASRRIEMLGFFPEQLADFLDRRCLPEQVHSVVLWSKNPLNLVDHSRIRECLKKYEQVFLHFTITGMGGSYLEPSVPTVEESLEMIPVLVEHLGDPGRMRVRFDPIVHLRLPDGGIYSNVFHFVRVARAAKAAGVIEIITSRMEPYPKVVNRLKKFGITPETLSPSERKKEADWLIGQADEIGVRLFGCCAEGLPAGSCINGHALSHLHPKGEAASTQKAKGQRPLCGCTESWDVGWYYKCPGGCLYCYANPEEPARLGGKKPEKP